MGNKYTKISKTILEKEKKIGKKRIEGGEFGYGIYEGELYNEQPDGYGFVIWNESENVLFSRWGFGKTIFPNDSFIIFNNMNYKRNQHLKLKKFFLSKYIGKEVDFMRDDYWAFVLLFGGCVNGTFEYNKMIPIEFLNKLSINDKRLKNMVINYYKNIYMKKFDFFNKLLENKKFVDLEISFF